ncbi:MAG: glutamine synthetase type III, partial [Clostridia bacterium]|nr:glutamine synthetase type III [Clostridia bacterium]
TLFGCKPPKGQELEDHYFGAIKTRVSAYMKELDEELWKLGVLAKTKHNEAAPSQHELAPIFATTNIATDHNQLTMEVMKKVAERHNLVCLLHEKPFAGVNGSGKHNNWSISTNTGVNLLKPGKDPENNPRFLLFLVAVLKAVDSHQDLLRISAASAGNDHRLGASEAPPAIMSVFLGDELTAILEAIETDTPYQKIKKGTMDGGVDVLPHFRKDTTDRNRTSPFAFTGNKFEFRMLGSAFSISCSNIILNTIVADVLCEFADRLETAKDFDSEVMEMIKETVQKHKRIIFNGNNYSDEWVEEAEKRGLLNLKTTPEALPHYISDENVALFGKHKIYSRTEMESRCEVLLDSYSKVINIEALTMLEMVRREILPACSRFANDLCVSIQNKAATVGAGAYEMDIAKKVTALTDELYLTVNRLADNLEGVKTITDGKEIAQYYCDNVLSVMNEARELADNLEMVVGKEYWPYPSYGELLFSV